MNDSETSAGEAQIETVVRRGVGFRRGKGRKGEGAHQAASFWAVSELDARAAFASSSRLAAPRATMSAQNGPGMEFRSAQRCGVEA